MGSLGCALVDLDFLTPMADARTAMGPKQVLLGNLDPVGLLRDGTSHSIESALEECYRAALPRYTVGAGCEVPRGTPTENLCALDAFARSHHP